MHKTSGILCDTNWGWTYMHVENLNKSLMIWAYCDISTDSSFLYPLHVKKIGTLLTFPNYSPIQYFILLLIGLISYLYLFIYLFWCQILLACDIWILVDVLFCLTMDARSFLVSNFDTHWRLWRYSILECSILRCLLVHSFIFGKA